MPNYIADDTDAIRSGLERLEAERKHRFQPARLEFSFQENAAAFCWRVIEAGHLQSTEYWYPTDSQRTATDFASPSPIKAFIDWLCDLDAVAVRRAAEEPFSPRTAVNGRLTNVAKLCARLRMLALI